jgi:signal transduction histidine kinase
MSAQLLEKGKERKKRVLIQGESAGKGDYARNGHDPDLKSNFEKAKEEIERLRGLIRQKDEEISRLNDQNLHFLNSAAHDLRNPLGVIQMYCEFMVSEPSDSGDESVREFISVISGTGKQMQGIINNMLDYSKLESGRIALELMPVEMDHLLHKAVMVYSARANSHGVALQLESADSGMVLNIDGHRIEQALHNLIDNAIKFSAPSTTVSIRSEKRENGFYVYVRDEGQGIPADEHKKLFRPFGKTSVQPLNGDSRTGLGLAIVKTIVEKHNGSAGFESEPGHGSEFYFWLPL